MRFRAWLATIYWLMMLGLLLATFQLGARSGTSSLEGGLTVLGLMGFATAGALIVVKRPENLIGWIFCADVVLILVGELTRELARYALATRPIWLPAPEWLVWINAWIGDSGWVLLLTFTFLLFPTGRLPSRRWRPLGWLIVAMLGFHTFVTMLKPGPFMDWPEVVNPLGLPLPAWLPAWLSALDEWLGQWVVLPLLGSIASLYFRYRAARGEERRQIKWIALLAALIGSVVAVGVLGFALGQDALLALAFNAMFVLALLGFPIAVGISILRHRLFDIDVLIRRTLVYSVITGLLALAYFAAVLVLQPPLARLTGQGTQLATVLSTLIIAGLFVPLRSRVQRGIDRRFYRGKVDAARTLAVFGAAARDEVDLDQLTGALLESVGGAFEPEHLSLWLPSKPVNGGRIAQGRPAASTR